MSTVTITNIEYDITQASDKFWQVRSFINGEYSGFRQYKTEQVEAFLAGRFYANAPTDAAVTYRLVPLTEKMWQIVRDIDGEMDTYSTQPVAVINEFLLQKVVPFTIHAVGDVIEVH